MARTVPDWRGRSDDTAPPARVKLRIVERQGGICGCGCGVKLGLAGEGIQFDHILPLGQGGENAESNLQALRLPCHGTKTRADRAAMAKERRIRKKTLGLAPKPGRKLPGGKDSPWKRKVGGGAEPRDL